MIHLEAGRNHFDSPTGLNLGQKRMRLLPFATHYSIGIIQRHPLLHRNHNHSPLSLIAVWVCAMIDSTGEQHTHHSAGQYAVNPTPLARGKRPDRSHRVPA
jgi:hypothetical protein